MSGDTNFNNDTTTLLLTVIDSSRDAGVTSASTVITDPIYTGTSVSFNATVKNFGIANLPEVPVRYKIDSDTNTISLSTGAVNSGDTASLLFTDAQSFTPNAAGNYTLRFYTTLAGDTNFNNDTTTLLLTVIDSSRDAGVTSASTVITDPIYTGTSVSFNATIKNFGIANLPEVPVRYKIDSDTNAISLNTGAVNSGDTASLLFTDAQSFTPNAAGNYTLRFYTTLTGDTNFNNDTTTLLLTVIDSSRDAGVTSVSTVIPDPIYTGTEVSFIVTVKNFGLANFSAVPVSYKIEGDPGIDTLNTETLNSGDTTSVLFGEGKIFTPPGAGSYVLKFYTTLTGDINNNNDTTTIQLSVVDSSRDAGVIGATVTIPGPIYAGKNISFNALVSNFGLANLNSIPVGYRAANDSAVISSNTGAVYSGDTTSVLFTGIQSFTPVYPGEYVIKFFTSLTGDTNFNNDTATLQLNILDSLGVDLTISVIPEGFYNYFRKELNLSDTVTAYLRETNSPYNIVDLASAVIDSVTFDGEFRFENAPVGSYYIMILHRNSIETWSEIAFNSTTMHSYDFTSSQSTAFGNNLVRIDSLPNKFGIYSGDINQDGSIDGSDMNMIDNAAFEFLEGYIIQDCNGDNVVDGSDALISSNNAENFIGKVTP